MKQMMKLGKCIIFYLLLKQQANQDWNLEIEEAVDRDSNLQTEKVVEDVNLCVEEDENTLE